MRSQQHTCLQSHCQCSRSAWDVNTCNEKGIWIKTSTNVSMYICVTPLVLMPTAAKEQLAFKWSKSHNCFSLLLQKWLLSQCLQTENRIRWDCNKQTLPMQCCNLISKNSTCRILGRGLFIESPFWKQSWIHTVRQHVPHNNMYGSFTWYFNNYTDAEWSTSSSFPSTWWRSADLQQSTKWNKNKNTC